MRTYAELLKAAQAKVAAAAMFEKRSFVPIDPATGVPPAQPDPNTQGMPPGAGGGMPMDPAAMGGGAPLPTDPSMAGGAPPQGGGGGGMDPSQPVQLTLADLMQFMQMMGSGGGTAPTAPQPAAGGAPAPAEGGDGKKGGGKAKDGDALARLESKLDQLAAILTGQMNALSMGTPGGGPPGGGGGQPSPDALGLGAAPMGAGADPNSIPAEPPTIPGPPPGMPGAGGGGMTAQAEARADGVAVKKAEANNALRLNRIINNLRRG